MKHFKSLFTIIPTTAPTTSFPAYSVSMAFNWMPIASTSSTKRIQTWQANELTLIQATAQGQYSNRSNALADHEELAWLSSQPTPTPQGQIDLRHAIWNLFDPGQFAVTDGMQADLNGLAAAQPSFSISSFDNYLFLEAIPTPGASLAQAFMIATNTSDSHENPGSSPESGTVLLTFIGLALIGFSGLHLTKRLFLHLRCKVLKTIKPGLRNPK